LHYTKNKKSWGEIMNRQVVQVLGIGLFSVLNLCQAGEDSIRQKQPDNIVEFTCQDFSEHADRCDNYTCDTPSVLDPTIKMTWAILSAQGNRCLISYTTADVGLKTSDGNPEPITKVCEYDANGISQLNNLMEQIQNGYFIPSTLSDLDGSYNCSLNSAGDPLKQKPYEVPSDS
jgi:hypothetical protein